MGERLRILLHNAFNIRKGELLLASLMQAYIFLIITVLLIVKPTINALFIHELGAKQLPYAYCLVAVFAILSSYFYNKIVKRFPLKKVITVTLITFCISFLGLSFAVSNELTNHIVLYFYYLNVSIFGVLATSQFWLFANMVLNTREAKRLFGIIGAGAIAGGIFGGYLTNILSTIIGNQNVILIASALLLICLPLLSAIWSRRKLRIKAHQRTVIEESESAIAHKSSFKLVFESKHLTYLAVIVGVGVVVSKLIDYQFSNIAHIKITDVNELASFFGFWFSTFNVIALVIQLFLTNRVLNWLGVASSMMILPLSLAISAVVALLFPVLGVFVLLKGVDGIFKQSIYKAAGELSIMPIPMRVKNQAKSYIDVVVDSIATGFAGVILFLLVSQLNLKAEVITSTIIILLFVWLVMIFKLREEYFKSFVKNIRSSLIEEHAVQNVSVRRKTIGSAKVILESGTDEEIILLLQRLDNYRSKKLRRSIVRLLNHTSVQVKIQAIHHLYNYEHGAEIDKVVALAESSNGKVVGAALEYIVLHTDAENEPIFETFLDHENKEVANKALLCLARESRHNAYIKSKFGLEQRVNDLIQSLKANKDQITSRELSSLLIIFAYSNMTDTYEVITKSFYHKDDTVVYHAIEAAGITGDPRFLSVLLIFVTKKKYRNKATAALKAYGTKASSTLLAYYNANKLSEEVKPHIPFVLESINNPSSIRILIRLLKSKEEKIRRQSAKSLVVLSQKRDLAISTSTFQKYLIHECQNYVRLVQSVDFFSDDTMLSKADLDLINSENEAVITLKKDLINDLTSRKEESFRCIFDLLSLCYDETDFNTIYIGLISEKEEARFNGLELIENLLTLKLKSSVIPIIEHHIFNSRENITAMYQPFSNDAQAMMTIVSTSGVSLLKRILLLIEQEPDKDYSIVVNQLIKHKNPEIRKIAQKIIREKVNVSAA